MHKVNDFFHLKDHFPSSAIFKFDNNDFLNIQCLRGEGNLQSNVKTTFHVISDRAPWAAFDCRLRELLRERKTTGVRGLCAGGSEGGFWVKNKIQSFVVQWDRLQ